MSLAGVFVLVLLLYGSAYAFPGLVPLIADEFDSSRVAVGGAFGVYLLVVAGFAPLAGSLVDKIGIRPALVLGTVTFGTALTGVGLAQSTSQVFVSIVGLGAPAHATIQVGVMVATSGIGGTARRGGAFGVLGAGIGLGLALLPPAAVWLASMTGWRTAMLALAVLSTALGIVAANFVQGYQRLETRNKEPRGGSSSFLRSKTFVLLFLGGIGVGLLDEAVYQHLIPHLQASGLPSAEAAAVLGIVSCGYLGGQALGGVASDRLGRLSIGLIAAAASAAAVLWLGIGLVGLSSIVLKIVAATYGIGLGATIVVRNTALADAFHGLYLGRVLGVYQWAYALGGAGMAWLGNAAYERVGSYLTAFVTAAVAAVLWAACLRAALRRSDNRPYTPVH
jgi:predicted MFS family arabinose efflux permease